MSAIATSSSETRWRWIGRTVVGLVAAAIIATAFCMYSGIQTSLTAERHLHAMTNAIGACSMYVEQHNGAWPRSLSDVERLYPDKREWIPHDSVHIDFDADPAVLAQQDLQSFAGIRVDQPIYRTYDSQLDALIKVLRRFHGVEKTRQNKPVQPSRR